ncbi:acyltransferase family protein [Aquabacterium sp. CECT 9606]|uniref:acyltransferase family protein n=1 Tax=Aquabacterium sp. CECT 9606 TaxID=2845822 RepID=UPI001E4CBBE6|nr:acyltransferase [Aquabacterium sp. CECT 9606]
MKTRNVALDYAKGIGILIVVFAHLLRGLQGSGLLKGVDEHVIQAISSACTIISMPAFFMASGLLYGANIKKRHGMNELAGKFDGIFYPYLIWSLIIGTFEILGNGVRNGSTSPYDLMHLLWSPKGIFWFLYALLMAFISVEILIKLLGVARAPIALVAFSIGLLLAYPYLPAIFCLREFSMSLVYFALGVFLADRFPKTQVGSWGTLVVATCALFALEYFAHMVMGVSTGSTRSITPNVFWLGISSLALMLAICYSLPSSGLDWLLNLGSRSMDIYLVHILFVATVRIVLDKFLNVQSVPVYLALGMFFGVFGSLALTSFMKKTRLKYLLQPPEFLSLKARLSPKVALQVL